MGSDASKNTEVSPVGPGRTGVIYVATPWPRLRNNRVSCKSVRTLEAVVTSTRTRATFPFGFCFIIIIIIIIF